jgi:hypothetical protein
MAPLAAQGAALQENRRADSRAVLQGVFLNVKDKSRFHAEVVKEEATPGKVK